MIHHIVLRTGGRDAYVPLQTGPEEAVVPLSVEPISGLPHVGMDANVWETLDHFSLTASASAVELFRAAAAVYAADLRVPRRRGYDRWTREFVLHLPVADVATWEGVTTPLRRLLEFLSGDRWEVRFREAAYPQPPRNAKELAKGGVLEADAVCLLSGGLDSFIGAAEALAGGKKLALVSHNAKGHDRFSSPAQKELVKGLAVRFGPDSLRHVRFRLNPPPPDGQVTGKEPSQRSRSILFIGLGILVASCLQSGTPLLIPENGFISLNVPLTSARLGSYSTRTTHPYTLDLLRSVLGGLGIDVPLVNPYRFVTKGQMLERLCAAEAELVRALAVEKTNSCAHPNERNHDRGRPQPHCGYCVPCLIRRSALDVVGLDHGSQYRYDVRTERALLSGDRSKDIIAAEIALARAADHADIDDVLRSGPIPPSEAEEYTVVYRSGLDEVAQLLLGRPVAA
ncbi:MAG TPA: Qat anti-phage system QueC-like protein QatC [Longimicrobium sp.]|jgi:7-cyano-7-deazaguanine synthase in queuosine biosynthesis